MADRNLSRVAGALARVEGRREALTQRAATLKRELELAKGRLALKNEVEAFIEEVHESTSRRSLETFETLLSALVQEVLPGEKQVSLVLSTERGRASLDICVRRQDGNLEDVLEDNGGALTNVIGMALRLIAVVKADVGRFLALDEADCWIAPDRVSAFYKVLEDGAARLGVQCLAVSHHDLSQFGEQVHIARVVGDPQEGARVVSSDRAAEWDDVRSGLRYIRLIDVQAYKDSTLLLSPGVNALIGPNNRGKSTFIRALRAVFYGEARDSLVRAGARMAVVEIGVSGRQVLRFSRRPGRTPVNIWSLHEADGSVVEGQGMRYETGGRAVPAWVEDLFRITKVEDLDVHIAHQKFPVFLLGEPATRRSAVLSIGQEAGYVRNMLAIHRDRCVRDNAFVRTGESQLIEITQDLELLQDADSIRDALAVATVMSERMQAAAARLQALEARASHLAEARRRLATARARLDATAELPAPQRAADIARTLARSREREIAGRRMLDLDHALAIAKARHAALRLLPKGPPETNSTITAEDALRRLAELRSALGAARKKQAEIADALAGVRAEMIAAMDDSGGLCPTCGSSVDAEAMLQNHVHRAAA
jgi:hypothetical protein